MKKYKCIIIDDDELDRLSVISCVKRFSQFEIVGIFDSAIQAIEHNILNEIDVLFSDIDMPDLNGLDFRRKVQQIPVCVFITSHPEHAAEGFDVEAFDFIVKPINYERFEKTVTRIDKYFSITNNTNTIENSTSEEEIYIKEGHDLIKLKLKDILYLEALKDYTLVVTPNKKHCVLCSLGNILKELHFQSFVRTHRSYAVQKSFIKRISTNEIELENSIFVPVGRSFKDNLNFCL